MAKISAGGCRCAEGAWQDGLREPFAKHGTHVAARVPDIATFSAAMPKREATDIAADCSTAAAAFLVRLDEAVAIPAHNRGLRHRRGRAAQVVTNR